LPGADDMTTAVKSFNARPFSHLLNAAELMPGTASRTYLELERELCPAPPSPRRRTWRPRR